METHGLKFHYQSGFLFLTLPSGRQLAYVKPRMGENQFGGEYPSARRSKPFAQGGVLPICSQTASRETLRSHSINCGRRTAAACVCVEKCQSHDNQAVVGYRPCRKKLRKGTMCNGNPPHCSPASHARTLASIAEKSATINFLSFCGTKAVRISCDRVSGNPIRLGMNTM